MAVQRTRRFAGEPAPATAGGIAARGAGEPPVHALIDRLVDDADTGYLPDRSNNRSPARLGVLADHDWVAPAIDPSGWSAPALTGLLHTMLTIRAAEQRLGALVEQGHAVCPVHLAIGQEAVPTGVSRHLNARDQVFGGHRSHGHYIALGGDLYRLFAEVLGRADGCTGGMGGSMHLYAPEVGFAGSVPIVAATVPIAVGAALAARMDGGDAVAVCYFGDGAVEEGAVHESLNLAAQMSLPVLFVCENNLYSSHLDIELRQPSDRTARFAVASGIAHAVVDGNDVLAVADAAGALIAAARAGDGPGYLEAVTYRWRGHVGPDENTDVGLRRSQTELAAWKRRDPVARLAAAMTARGDITRDAIEGLVEDLEILTLGLANRALAAPYPEPEALFKHVFAPRRCAS